MRIYIVLKKLTNEHIDEALSMGWVIIASWINPEDMVKDEPEYVSNISFRLAKENVHMTVTADLYSGSGSSGGCPTEQARLVCWLISKRRRRRHSPWRRVIGASPIEVMLIVLVRDEATGNDGAVDLDLGVKPVSVSWSTVVASTLDRLNTPRGLA